MHLAIALGGLPDVSEFVVACVWYTVVLPLGPHINIVLRQAKYVSSIPSSSTQTIHVLVEQIGGPVNTGAVVLRMRKIQYSLLRTALLPLLFSNTLQ